MSREELSPSLSLLINSKDREACLRRALESVGSQTLKPEEILILDDGSKAAYSLESLPSFESARVEIFRNEISSGVARGRNFLMKKASGDILVILDDDAVFSNSRCLENCVKSFENKPALALVAFKITDHGEDRPRFFVPFSRRVIARQPRIVEEVQKVSYFLGGGHALRKSVFLETDGYDSNLFFGEEELDLSYRILKLGYELEYQPSIEVDHYPEKTVLSSEGPSPRDELSLHVQNRFFLAKKYLPFRYWPTYFAYWLSVYFFKSARELKMKSYLRGLSLGFRSLWNQKRQVLTSDQIQYLKQNHGRLLK